VQLLRTPLCETPRTASPISSRSHSATFGAPDRDACRQVPTGRQRAGSRRRCGRTRAARALRTRRTARRCRARPVRRPRSASSCRRRRRVRRPPRRCTRLRAPPRGRRSVCWQPTRRPLRPPQACSCAVAAGRLSCCWSDSQCCKRRTHQRAHGYNLAASCANTISRAAACVAGSVPLRNGRHGY